MEPMKKLPYPIDPIFSDEKSCSPVRTIRGKDVEKSHRHRSEPAFYFIGLVPSGYLTLFMGFHGIIIHLRGYTFCDLTYSSYESHGGNVMKKYIYICIIRICMILNIAMDAIEIDDKKISLIKKQQIR